MRFARRWQSWVGPSVAPIEGVQLRVGVLKLKSELAACVDTTMHRVTHLGLLVFEAVGQHDAGLLRQPITESRQERNGIPLT